MSPESDLRAGARAVTAARALLRIIESGMNFLSCAAAFLLMLLISADAAGRYLFNAPVKGAYEITELYLMMAIVMFGLGATQRTGGHVRITLLSDLFPASLNRWLNVVFLLAALAVFGIATVAAGQLAMDHLLAGRTQGTLGLPVGPSWLVLVVGLAALCLRFGAQLVDCLLGRPFIEPPSGRSE